MRFIAPFWGLAGVFFLIGYAIARLTPRALTVFEGGLNAWHWIILVIWTLFMAVGEGYRGFQKRFSPRTAARARYLFRNPKPLHTVLAPFFCMGYFHARRRVQIASIALTLGIVALVLLVAKAPQPWRGIIDFGVVLGLTWGILSLAASVWQAFTRAEYPHSPETPEISGTGTAESPVEKSAG